MKVLNIATLLALLNVVDHSSSSSVLATTTKTSDEYETQYETIPKQLEDDVVVVAPLPTLLRGAKKAVYQFLSDGVSDSEELSCSDIGQECNNDEDCCGDDTYCETNNHGQKACLFIFNPPDPPRVDPPDHVVSGI